MPALVLPVQVELALRWHRGELGDNALLAGSDFLQPGEMMIYIAALFGRQSWRELREQCAAWSNAQGAIARTSHPTVAAWLTHYGGKRSICDGNDQWRYLVPKIGLDAFLQKTTHAIAPS
jgi:hypothetical protein